MEDLRKYTRRTELYKLSAEEQTEKMKLSPKKEENNYIQLSITH